LQNSDIPSALRRGECLHGKAKHDRTMPDGFRFTLFSFMEIFVRTSRDTINFVVKQGLASFSLYLYRDAGSYLRHSKIRLSIFIEKKVENKVEKKVENKVD
jgi:hypothetical protein